MTVSLFDPLKIDGLELKSRIAMAPMTRNRADQRGVPTPMMATYYGQRASAGLIVTEATQVSDRSNGYVNTPGLYTEAQVRGWQAVTQAVHAAGGVIFAQLWHAGRVSHTTLQPNGDAPLAPSAIAAETQVVTPEGFAPASLPRAIAAQEITQIVNQFEHAAKMAKQAGFDGIEVHGANGYLIDQFLKDGSNQRTDDYGGSVENRIRFALDVVAATVGVWGPDRVGVRISPRGIFNGMRDSDPGTLAATLAAALDRYSLAYLHLLDPLPDHPSFGVQAEIPEVVSSVRQNYNGVIILNGGYDQQSAQNALAENQADVIAFGLPYIANPDLVDRYRRQAALNEVDMATLYGGDEKGYTDYPFLD